MTARLTSWSSYVWNIAWGVLGGVVEGYGETRTEVLIYLSEAWTGVVASIQTLICLGIIANIHRHVGVDEVAQEEHKVGEWVDTVMCAVQSEVFCE